METWPISTQTKRVHPVDRVAVDVGVEVGAVLGADGVLVEPAAGAVVVEAAAVVLNHKGADADKVDPPAREIIRIANAGGFERAAVIALPI